MTICVYMWFGCSGFVSFACCLCMASSRRWRYHLPRHTRARAPRVEASKSIQKNNNIQNQQKTKTKNQKIDTQQKKHYINKHNPQKQKIKHLPKQSFYNLFFKWSFLFTVGCAHFSHIKLRMNNTKKTKNINIID